LNRNKKLHRKRSIKQVTNKNVACFYYWGNQTEREENFMRTVTETYNVYTYPELSEKAKEKVK